MLRNGQIDMVTSARKTSKREKEFAFSSPIGTSYAELCVQSGDSRFQLNDYSSFDGMTIGVLKANSRNDDLAALAQEKGFTYQMAEYDEEAELTEALHNGEVDGIDADVAENIQTIAFDSRIEALQAVKDGTADACYVYTYMAEKYVNQDPDGEQIFHIVNMPAANLSVGIRPTTDHELISILNKCLICQ